MENVYNFEVEGFHTYHIGELGVWVHNDNCFGNVKLSGLAQNRPIRELTDAELVATFKNTNIKLYGKSAKAGGGNTGHGLMRMRDPRLASFGIETPNDIARILNKGHVVPNPDAGTIGRVLNGVEVVLDSSTYRLITVTPR